MAKPRGRAPGFRMPEEHRLKIQNSNILNALIEHATGKREMTATQVTAGLGLLKKVLPDLQATTISGDDDKPPVRMEIGWKSSPLTSTTSPAPSSATTTSGKSDGPAS